MVRPALLTLELTDFDDETDVAVLSLRDCGRIERAIEDAAEFLHELRSRNGDYPMTDSPTFVAEFADGEVTRMTTFTSLKRLDVERGVRLAKHAYRSRKGQEPPAIVKAHFESNGVMIEAYSSVDLEDIDETDDKVLDRIEIRAQESHENQLTIQTGDDFEPPAPREGAP